MNRSPCGRLRRPEVSFRMPIYEYVCSCGHAFEELIVRSTDEAEVACRSCGGREVKRQMSRPAAPSSGGRDAATRACGPVG